MDVELRQPNKIEQAVHHELQVRRRLWLVALPVDSDALTKYSQDHAAARRRVMVRQVRVRAESLEAVPPDELSRLQDSHIHRCAVLPIQCAQNAVLFGLCPHHAVPEQ